MRNRLPSGLLQRRQITPQIKQITRVKIFRHRYLILGRSISEPDYLFFTDLFAFGKKCQGKNIKQFEYFLNHNTQ